METSSLIVRAARRLEHLEGVLSPARCDAVACAVTKVIEHALTAQGSLVVTQGWEGQELRK